MDVFRGQNLQFFEDSFVSQFPKKRLGNKENTAIQYIRTLIIIKKFFFVPCTLTLYKQNIIRTNRRTAPATQTGITHLGSPLEGTATSASGFSCVPT